jgi:hypothetical protein
LKVRISARDKLRDYLSSNVGKVLRTRDLREVAGISDYARRIRELRDDEGLSIKSHKERPDLRPDEYILESLERVPVGDPRIPASTRKTVLDRDGKRCRLCGVTAEPTSSTRASGVKLRIDYIEALEQGGTDQIDNVGVICSECAKTKEKARRGNQSARELVVLIRRASPAVQREVYAILKRSFEGRN